jgi:transketolase
MGSLRAKFEAFGWDVLDLEKGNDISSVISILKKAKEHTGKGKPVMILMKTEMGNGVDFMMGSHKWHGVAPNDDQLAQALKQNPETLGDY